MSRRCSFCWRTLGRFVDFVVFARQAMYTAEKKQPQITLRQPKSSSGAGCTPLPKGHVADYLHINPNYHADAFSVYLCRDDYTRHKKHPPEANGTRRRVAHRINLQWLCNCNWCKLQVQSTVLGAAGITHDRTTGAKTGGIHSFRCSGYFQPVDDGRDKMAR